MTTKGTITESALLDALSRAITSTAPADARSVVELADDMEWDERHVRKALAKLNQQGRLVVHHVITRGIDGRNCRTPKYTITPAPKLKLRKA